MKEPILFLGGPADGQRIPMEPDEMQKIITTHKDKPGGGMVAGPFGRAPEYEHHFYRRVILNDQEKDSTRNRLVSVFQWEKDTKSVMRRLLDSYGSNEELTQESAEPITEKWLLSRGYKATTSPRGPGYNDHFEKNGLNIWRYNDTDEWLWTDYDSLSFKTQGQLQSFETLFSKLSYRHET